MLIIPYAEQDLEYSRSSARYIYYLSIHIAQNSNPYIIYLIDQLVDSTLYLD